LYSVEIYQTNVIVTGTKYVYVGGPVKTEIQTAYCNDHIGPTLLSIIISQPEILQRISKCKENSTFLILFELIVS